MNAQPKLKACVLRREWQLACSWLLVGVIGICFNLRGAEFQNPINPGPDPWMQYYQGNYYLSTSQGDAIRIWKSPTIGGLRTAEPVTVWKDSDPSRSTGVWAPEFHAISNRWYLYYTATSSDGLDDNHRMHVLESEGADPLGPYAYKGRLVNPTNDNYAIDGTVFQTPDGAWFFVWAARPGHVLTIAPMKNPWTLNGNGVVLSASGFGCDEVREGPVVLRRNGRLFLTYSACDTGKPDYKIGMLIADEDANVMDPRSWKQHPHPIFERNDEPGVFGPGHHGFFQSPDGTEDWIVYHAKTTTNYTYRGRTTRVQKFAWNKDGTPELGRPVPLDTMIEEPSCQANTFTNPIVTHGADPWVTQWQGDYYFCQSRRGSIWVNKAEQLSEIGRRPWARVWTPPSGTAWSEELWAPELHYLRGRWYIYVAADDGDNRNHRMYVLEGTSQDPEQPFEFRSKIADPSDRWAIDGTVLQMPDDQLYFVWSGWEGTENVAQHLYIAPMSNPLTISGERVCISSPIHEWERHGDPLVNEGPEALWNGDTLFIIYSASGSWGDDYCLGQLTLTGGDVLDPQSWAKMPEPVFSGTDDVISPGHASFVKSRDGTEDWIVYHTAKHPGAGWNRQVQTQRFQWNEDGSPCFGVPVAVGTPQTSPSGE